MKKRVAWIDTVKGIAILMIFCIHMEGWLHLFEKNELILRLIHKGLLGVELTYFINAFLLCMKYDQVSVIPNNRATSDNKWGGVLLYSILRIFPLYILSLVIYLIYNNVGILNENPSVINIISHFLMFAWLNPHWWITFPGNGYMQVLFLMWLIFPFYKKTVKNFESAMMGFSLLYAITSIFSFEVSHFSLNSSSTTIDLIFYICRGIQSFALGTVFFYIPEGLYGFKNKKNIALSLVIISFVSCGLLVIFNCGAIYLYLPFLFLFVLALRIYPLKLFVNPITCFLGKYIFGIYVFHILLYFFLNEFVHDRLLIIILDFSLSVLLSAVLNNFFEIPVASYLKRKIRL